MEATPRGPMRFETAAIHAGQDPDAPYGAVNVPIYQTSTYAQPSVGRPKVFDYARGGNPTREAFQQALAALEGGERASPSGVGWRAESTLLLTLRPGDHVALVRRRLRRDLPAPVEGARALGSVVLDRRPQRPRAIRASAPAPKDARRLARDPVQPDAPDRRRRGGRRRPRTRQALGSSWTTRSPRRRCSDRSSSVPTPSSHSVTKYIGGHSDLIGGAVVTSDPEWIERLGFLAERRRRGPRSDGFATWASAG